MATKQTPKSCSCEQCMRGKRSRGGKIMMKKDERAFRHNQKQALNTSRGVYDAAPTGGYYD